MPLYSIDGNHFYPGDETEYRWMMYHVPDFEPEVALQILRDAGLPADLNSRVCRRIAGRLCLGAFEWKWTRAPIETRPTRAREPYATPHLNVIRPPRLLRMRFSVARLRWRLCWRLNKLRRRFR